MIDANTFSIAASIVSVILAVLAITFSILFFVLSKKTETQALSSLTKIETQADSLQKLTGRWMDRLTRYVTSERPSILDESFPQLLTILSQLPQAITATITQVPARETADDTIYSFYIILYFYTAQTNYWVQSFFPKASEFDDSNNFHQLVKRIIDMSHADFTTLAGILANLDQAKLSQNANAYLLNETKEFWRHNVRSTFDILIPQQKQ